MSTTTMAELMMMMVVPVLALAGLLLLGWIAVAIKGLLWPGELFRGRVERVTRWRELEHVVHDMHRALQERSGGSLASSLGNGENVGDRGSHAAQRTHSELEELLEQIARSGHDSSLSFIDLKIGALMLAEELDAMQLSHHEPQQQQQYESSALAA